MPRCIETSSSSSKAPIATTSSLPIKAPSVSNDFEVALSDENIEVYLKNLPSDPGLRPSIVSYPPNLIEQILAQNRAKRRRKVKRDSYRRPALRSVGKIIIPSLLPVGSFSN